MGMMYCCCGGKWRGRWRRVEEVLRVPSEAEMRRNEKRGF
jgi:hypothetical protein